MIASHTHRQVRARCAHSDEMTSCLLAEGTSRVRLQFLGGLTLACLPQGAPQYTSLSTCTPMKTTIRLVLLAALNTHAPEAAQSRCTYSISTRNLCLGRRSDTSHTSGRLALSIWTRIWCGSACLHISCTDPCSNWPNAALKPPKTRCRSMRTVALCLRCSPALCISTDVWSGRQSTAIMPVKTTCRSMRTAALCLRCSPCLTRLPRRM